MLLTDGEIASSLLEVCRRECPGRQSLCVSDVARISSGWECEVYSFALESEERGERQREDLILRLYPGDRGEVKAAREFDVMAQLHRAGFPVPRVLFLESEGASFGKPFMVMEKIDGALLGPAIQQATGERRRELLSLFCRIFVDLHAFDWRPFVPDQARYRVDGHVAAQVAWAERFIRRFPGNDFDPVLEWLKERSGEVECRGLSVTHGDFHPWNILLRADGKPFVIDRTQADISDYRFDLAWTLLVMSTSVGPEMHDVLLGEYERLAGRRVEGIEYFEVMASTKRLFAMFVSLTQGATKLGMREGAEALMRRNVGHFHGAYSMLRDRSGLTIPAVESLLSDLT